MGYIATLSENQKRNIDLLIDTMNEKGVRNPYTQAAMLAVISKESSFIPAPEISYKNTGVSRIREIFGGLVAGLSDSQLEALKKDDKAFFNKVYGKRFGNDGYSSSWSGYKESWALPYKDGNDGWRYRGAGFNQLTFKGNFKTLSKASGIDLLKYPEKLQDPKIAAGVAVDYFLYNFKNGYSSAHQSHYNSPNLDSFKNEKDSTLAVYHANAGFGKPMYNATSAESTGGLKKALQRVPELLTYVLAHTGVKKNSH